MKNVIPAVLFVLGGFLLAYAMRFHSEGRGAAGDAGVAVIQPPPPPLPTQAPVPEPAPVAYQPRTVEEALDAGLRFDPLRRRWLPWEEYKQSQDYRFTSDHGGSIDVRVRMDDAGWFVHIGPRGRAFREDGGVMR